MPSHRIPGGDSYRAFCERLYRQNEFAIKLGTERMRAALDGEGAPDEGFTCVLVAGTNGKGSVSSLLHAGLVGAGLRVGLYTSPHLVEIRERIRVDGAPITEDDFVRLGREALKRWGDDDVPVEQRLTYFELVTLVAARWFAEQGVDAAVFEIGLGGRLDACNALEPALSVITRVARDHERHLGDTIESIVGEKAGVLRAGRPAVVCLPDAWDEARTLSVMQTYGPSRLVVEGRDFGVDAQGGVVVEGRVLGHHWVPFEGAHQRVNAACAVATLRLLEPGLERDPGDASRSAPEVWAQRVGAARWPGRWQRVSWRGREIVLEGAHNPSGAQAAAAQIAETFDGRVTLVMAALGDKRIDEMLDCLQPHVARLIAPPLDNPRALPPETLAERAAERGLEVVAAGGVVDALERADPHPEPIVVLGSLYLVGDVLHALGLRADDLPVLAGRG